jgi:DNA-binding winged helix-turn-helix (wHTH) protein/tetratricopeptide (TPR) repeat protein
MAPETWQSGDLWLDVGQQRVLQAGVPVVLPRLSFDLLLALMRATPNFVSNEELMAQVWRGVVVSPETVTQRVKLLRDALGDDPKQPRYVEGLRGRGYRLVPAPAPAAAAPASTVARRPGAKWWRVTGLLVAALAGVAMLLHGRAGDGNAMPAGPECAIPMDAAIPPRVPSRNVEADIQYLEGRRLLSRYTIVDSVTADSKFRRAWELDSTFVPAIVGLYDARLQAAKIRRMGMAEARTANAYLLQQAQELQPDSGAVQLARAMWEPAEALSPQARARLYEEGLKKEPGDARAMTAYAELLDKKLHRRDEGTCMLQRALHANPQWAYARYLVAARTFEEVGAGVEQHMRKLLDEDPTNYRVLQSLAKYVWMNHGETAGAISYIERAIGADPQNPWAPHIAVAFYLDLGEPEVAKALARSNPVVQASTAALMARYDDDWRKAGEAAQAPGSFEFNVFERWGVTLSLRDHALKSGQLDAAIDLISSKYKLPLDRDWPITEDNFREAVLLAHLLLARGGGGDVARRLDQLITWLDATLEKLGPTNLRPKAQALALLGRTDEALQVLQESFRRQDYMLWWYTLQYDPTWDKLRGHPRFREIAAEVKLHVDSERSKLAAMRARGEVPRRDTAEAFAATLRK